MFGFDITDELRFIIEKLAKRDRKRAEIINRKIREIINNNENRTNPRAKTPGIYRAIPQKPHGFWDPKIFLDFCGFGIKNCRTKVRGIKPTIFNNAHTIDRYYNCSYGLKEYKHMHIDKSFVLLFKVDKSKNVILFAKLGHHDDFFKR